MTGSLKENNESKFGMADTQFESGFNCIFLIKDELGLHSDLPVYHVYCCMNKHSLESFTPGCAVPATGASGLA